MDCIEAFQDWGTGEPIHEPQDDGILADFTDLTTDENGKKNLYFWLIVGGGSAMIIALIALLVHCLIVKPCRAKKKRQAQTVTQSEDKRYTIADIFSTEKKDRI